MSQTVTKNSAAAKDHQSKKVTASAKRAKSPDDLEVSETPEQVTAKLFQNGRSQAVRLPKEFRFEGHAVRIRRVGDGVMLEPLQPKKFDVDAWFASMDRWDAGDPMPGGRNQGVLEPEEIFPDNWPQE